MQNRRRQFIEGKIIQLLAGINLSIILPVVITSILAFLLQTLGLTPYKPLHWLIFLPIFYMFFLITIVSLFAITNVLWGRSGQKPTRFDTRKHDSISTPMSKTYKLYSRMYFLFSLPLINFLYKMRPFQWLIMWGYSYGQHIGIGTRIYGRLDDPELITLGDDTIIGNDARLVAHSMTILPCRHFLYQSSPIDIGKRVSIGGNTLIQMGTRIGDDAIVEPGSVVLAFARIGKGEVWGGNPAVFKHVRKECAHLEEGNSGHRPLKQLQKTPDDLSSDHKLNQEVMDLIANSLEISTKEINLKTHADDIEQWDSLGMMAISAAIHDRYNTSVPFSEMLSLNSVKEISNWLLIKKQDTSDTKKETNKFKLPNNPELFPLLNPIRVTTNLAKHQNLRPTTNHCTVCIAATFTIAPLANSLNLWTRSFGIDVDIQFCSFDQVLQELLTVKGSFFNNQNGVNIIVVRPEDLLTPNDSSGVEILHQYNSAFKTYLKQNNTPLTVSNLPPSLYLAEHEIVKATKLSSDWKSMLTKFPEISVLDFQSIIERIGTEHAKDIEGEKLAAKPFSDLVFQHLGIAISRNIRSLFFPSARVIALDCDNTLWKGVIGEDGLDGIGLEPTTENNYFIKFQYKLKELRKQGVLLTLVSRNNPKDVWEVFDKHPHMMLSREDITTSRINWASKSSNLHSIADELNLGLASFVFIDDSPHEQLDITTACPEVTVLPMPSATQQFCEMLSKLWIFDSRSITKEDRSRAIFMNQEQNRITEEESSASLDTFLRDLKLEVLIRPAKANDVMRITQLIQKTNQFNLSLRRHTETDVIKMHESHWIRVVEVSDRFGNYGMVGVCIIEPVISNTETLAIVDTFLLSCRALGRHVENTFLYALQNEIKDAGITTIKARFHQGPRNQPVRDFLLQMGFHKEQEKADNKNEILIMSPVKPIVIPKYVLLNHISDYQNTLPYKKDTLLM